MQMSKRKFIKTAVLSFIGLVAACKNNNLSNYKINLNQPTQGANMTFELPALPYSKNALAPHISENTINFHYGKHHQTYVTNFNNLLKDTDLIGKSLEEVIKISAVDKTKAGIFNNSAQVWNHTFYWHSMKPNGGGKPAGEILTKIEADFGSYENFVTEFKNAGTTQFGSGWAWLCVHKGGKLEVCGTPNQDNPLMPEVGCGGFPILGMDVWEHAYYLNYQNRRPDYIEAFFNLINWVEVERLYALEK
jgi:Fe-Mn family superoxide dismutase